MSPLIIGVGVVLLFGIVLVVLGLARSPQTDAIGDRLSQFTERTMSLSELELQQPFSQRFQSRDSFVAADRPQRLRRLQDHLVILSKRLALAQDVNEDRHDARVPAGDERVDDGMPQRPCGCTEHGVDRPGRRRIVNRGERGHHFADHARVGQPQHRLQQRNRFR